MRFRNRVDAGRRLAERLLDLQDESPIVLGLPRGGVPVAAEVARALNAPLDVWVVRKIGAPMQPELGLGAVAEGGAVYVDEDLARTTGTSREELEALIQQKKREVEARSQMFRHGRPPPDVRGRTVILVDDGIATGGTVRAALQTLRRAGPRKLVLAVPVAPIDTLEELAPLVDSVVCVAPVQWMVAIGAWYDDFTQTTNDEVLELLRMYGGTEAGTSPAP